MGNLLLPFFLVINIVLQAYFFVLIVMVVMSWLFTFNVINSYNPFVAALWRFLQSVTEPVLRPIRRRMPNLGGVDLSVFVLILAIIFTRAMLAEISRLITGGA